MYSIQVVSAAGKVKQSAAGEGYARFLCTFAYEEGDSINFFADAQHCVIQVDQALPEIETALKGAVSPLPTASEL